MNIEKSAHRVFHEVAQTTARTTMVDPDAMIAESEGEVGSDYWFNPCITTEYAERIINKAHRNGIETIVDLGAGDFRFSLFADLYGFDVVGYEALLEPWKPFKQLLGESGVDARCRDYRNDWEKLIQLDDVAYVAFGINNTLDTIPEKGITVNGHIGDVDWYVDGNHMGKL